MNGNIIDRGEDNCIYGSFVFIYFALNLSASIVIAATNDAWSRGLNWSFAEHPHLYRERQTLDEHAARALVDEMEFETLHARCEEVLRVGFKIYSDRYPHFSKIGTRARRFRAWKYHIVVDYYPIEIHCAVTLPFLQLLRLLFPNDVGLVFCGVFLREPETQKEHQFVKILEEMIDYADYGKLVIMDHFILLHEPDTSFDLNPDVEYFFRKSLQRNDEYKNVWDTRHLEPLLTRERKKFVSDAAGRKDLMSVLYTTPDCTKPEQ